MLPESGINEMHAILDLDRYPLHDLHSARGQALIRRCQDDLRQTGMFNLDGLVQPDAISRAVIDASPLMENSAFEHKRSHNVYFETDVPGVDKDHPVLRQFETINHTICADQIPENDLVKVYDWEPLRNFLAIVMEKQKLYTMPDRIACLNVMSYYDGETLNWHFDRSEFTTTLLLQSAHKGGHFEFRNNLRSEADPNHDGISRLIDGDDDQIQQLKLSPGTLNVFRGKNTLHRVTPVQGSRARIVAVFSYFERPGVMFSDKDRLGFYGRVN